MPELPEVETIKEALKRSIEGAEIEAVTIRNRHFREFIPEDFEQRILKSRVLKIYRKAKYIILNLSNNFCIIWHLGMSGKVKICEELPNLEKHDHVIISTNKGFIIYNDARRFGLITYTESELLNKHHLFIHTGLDPFDDTLNTEYLLKKFKNKYTSIKIALLDQSIINGIGNIYASEALFEAKISPLRLCCNISKDELTILINSIRKTLQKAILAGGSTLKDYRKPDGSMGYFQNQHCVYAKTGQRCPNCQCDINHTGGIKKIVQSGRSTFYCDQIQK